MTSQERKEARFQRRKAKRLEHKNRKFADCDDFDKVFSYENLYKSYKKCRCGVAWKSSTQKYITQAPLYVYRTYEKLHSGTYKPGKFNEFVIMERGKKRDIKAVPIIDRAVQRCLCDYALVPMLTRTFVYDNGASMKNKGYSFSVRRCRYHLMYHYHKYGSDGYVLTFDFSKFFDNIPHKVLKDIMNKEFTDQRIIHATNQVIDSFGDIGLGLGSQVSQIFALASANRLDHYIKEECRIYCYGRYMDDGYLIHPSKEYLQDCLEKIKVMCDSLGIKLNEKKTKITKLSHGFTFLKVRFLLLPNGGIIRKLNRPSITRQRRKLKKLRKLVDSGYMSKEDVYASWQSWNSYALNFNARLTVRNMENLYRELFEPNAKIVLEEISNE